MGTHLSTMGRAARLATGTVLLACGSAHAAWPSAITGVSTNRPADTAAGAAQISIVMDRIGDQACVTFSNNGPVVFSLARVYVDDDLGLLGPGAVQPGLGVEFSGPASPGDLPAGQEAQPSFTATQSFGAASPAPRNGVNPGEHLTICFPIGGAAHMPAVLHAMRDGSLRFGVHAIAFASGGSETFVTQPLKCPADIDGQPGIDARDLFLFLARWFTNDAAADISADGEVDFVDLFEFVRFFGKDC